MSRPEENGKGEERISVFQGNEKRAGKKMTKRRHPDEGDLLHAKTIYVVKRIRRKRREKVKKNGTCDNGGKSAIVAAQPGRLRSRKKNRRNRRSRWEKGGNELAETSE